MLKRDPITGMYFEAPDPDDLDLQEQEIEVELPVIVEKPTKKKGRPKR